MKYKSMNIYTWIGIILIGVTWYFIQKGARIAAQDNLEEMKTKLDSVEQAAISRINTTTDSTIDKIQTSSDEIISNLSTKATKLGQTIDDLEKATRKSAESIKKDIQTSKRQTFNKVEEDGDKTRNQVSEDGSLTRQTVTLNSNEIKNKIELGSSNTLKKRITETFYSQKKIFDNDIEKVNLKLEKRRVNYRGLKAIFGFGSWRATMLDSEKRGRDISKDWSDFFSFLIDSNTLNFEKRFIGFITTHTKMINEKDKDDQFLLNKNERSNLASLFTSNYDLFKFQSYFASKKRHVELLYEKSPKAMRGWAPQEINVCDTAINAIKKIENLAKLK